MECWSNGVMVKHLRVYLTAQFNWHSLKFDKITILSELHLKSSVWSSSSTPLLQYTG